MSIAKSIPARLISATPVPGHLRIETLPKRFPGLYLVFEMNVYKNMERLAPAYAQSSGYWEFIELSNGGFYMSLKSSAEFRVSVPGNYFEGCMSADAASLVANLFTYSQLAFEHHLDYICDGYRMLRDYVSLHPEARAIFSAID